MDRKLKIWEVSALIALCAALCAGTWAQGRRESADSKLLRLHVVAASDEPEEQEIKLAVRDAVLEYLEPRLERAADGESAREIVGAELEGVAAAARSVAQGRGVELRLGRAHYGTLEYGGYTLPAGDYDSLRVILGSGTGHNWWGVVFPPVCFASYDEGEARSAMGGTDYAILTQEEGYELRFRTLELWAELLEWLKR